jgi:hypothetical protein
MEKLLTPKDAAEILSLSPVTIKNGFGREN